MAKAGQEYRRKPLCPAQSDVFRAFELCPLKDLKVVMIGQDFWLFYISNLFIKLFCLAKFRIFVIIKIAKIWILKLQKT